MQNNPDKPATPEIKVTAINGWTILIFNLILILVGGYIAFTVPPGTSPSSAIFQFCLGMFIGALGLFSFKGHFTLEPNEARVLVLLGNYKGTVRTSGFSWANPLYSIGNKISLRSHNMNTETLKVNDKRGNPIEIAAVVVWRVNDTAQAMFDVVDYEKYLTVQSETAIRHLANSYAYDNGEEHEPTLRSSADEVAVTLKQELQERLSKAGVYVEEARITHLAYAPEIAQVMLRRQQAEAVIAARQKIVQGAVSMVEMALKELSDRDVVKLDDERRAAMVSNLLVVLCSETEATPVVNTGTLYT